MKALFGRKIFDLKELRVATEDAKKAGMVGFNYTVIREVELTKAEFDLFTSNFLKDQPWIEASDGGSNQAGELRCIRVKNVETKEHLLISTEGYDYPRYIAIEE